MPALRNDVLIFLLPFGWLGSVSYILVSPVPKIGAGHVQITLMQALAWNDDVTKDIPIKRG